LDVRQPLLNPDQLLQRKSAAIGIDISKLQVQRTREGLVFRVRQTYMQLQLAYEALRVLSSSMETADSLYRYTQDRVNEGLLSKADALNAQVQVTTIQTKMAAARSDIKNTSDALSLLMGKPTGQTYKSADPLKEETNPGITDTIVPAGRADLAALEKAKEAASLSLRSTKMSALPRLNAFGAYQFNDSRMFGFGANAYLAGVQLSWDIFKGNSVRSKAATQKQELNRLQTEISLQKEKSTAELRKALRSMDDAQYAIRQATAAVASGAESFRILRDRYQQGLAGSTDVLLAQDRLQQQQLSLAQAIFEHHATAAYIDYLTTNPDSFH
jgi:outer membrane protein TolC